jgi:hypothetical protein
MKYRYLIPLFAALLICLVSSRMQAQYQKGEKFVGANVSFLTDPYGYGLEFEYGYDDEIGLGFSVRYFGQPEQKRPSGNSTATITRYLVAPQLQAMYHLMPKETVDPYAGVRLGYAVYTEAFTTDDPVLNPAPEKKATSGLLFSLAGGMRYFFSPRISVNTSLELFLLYDKNYFVNQSNVTLSLGVDFTLK